VILRAVMEEVSAQHCSMILEVAVMRIVPSSTSFVQGLKRSLDAPSQGGNLRIMGFFAEVICSGTTAVPYSVIGRTLAART
jgi:hypothetical protein